jgi:hypothetical protein
VCEVAAAKLGNIATWHPILKAPRSSNRWAIIYSKNGIGCTECLGHDRERALKLGSAAVLFALKR